jgi:aspartate kinase
MGGILSLRTMKVYKFGGASIATAEKMTALLPIITDVQEPLLIVMSALGKTTNALEKVLNMAVNEGREPAMAAAEKLINEHIEYARKLLSTYEYNKAFNSVLSPLFAELREVVKSADAAWYDRSYDQIVCMGELLSTAMFNCYLQQQGVRSEWVDVRRVIRTDDNYRDAAIDWNYTKLDAEAIIGRKLKQGRVVVVQGFIGATASGYSVTLGREGSDYTAAVLAAMLGAVSVTIWKDVDGFRNADPKLFPDTVKINEISYTEVIEMAYYGAQIIHPKTIKPLHNNNIPLYVKCFLDRSLSGSVIRGDVAGITYPPLIVLKDSQVLIQVTTRDFSFITEDNLSRIYAVFHGLKIKVNMIQNAAISFVACIDNREDKVKAVVAALAKDYKVSLNEGVSILTVRHYTPEIFFGLTTGRQILLRQETRKTLQAVIR